MKLKNNFFYTIREDIKDEESISGKLLVRSGMIKKNSNGIYMYTPLGRRVVKNIEAIVREEMDRCGAMEVSMPSLIPEEIYINSGRRMIFGDNMFTLKDRYDRPYSLGPTHEELFVEMAKSQIKSYKDMPFNLYQVRTKFRDETRPRYGLIRTREFTMKDAYSFDANLDSLDKSYEIMFNAYKNIFDRIGLNYKIVRADTGAMGGLLSEEFQAITDIGEDILVLCETCDYASNIEISECVPKCEVATCEERVKELVYTPNIGSIADLEKSLNIPNSKMVKTLIYKVGEELVACLIRGNRELNDVKLSKLFNVPEVVLASEEEVQNVTGAKIGFAGPIDLKIKIIMDREVQYMKNFLVGANKTDYHYVGVNLRDFKYDLVADIVNVKEGDICPNCGGKLYFKKGIEVGNTFKLGDKYSKSLGLQYLDQTNTQQYVQMGCYGIGIERVMAAVAEQNHDEFGLIWPISIAPYKVSIVLINENDDKQKAVADKLYNDLICNNISVLYDNRDERPGVKFNDMDLIGIPIRITIGKKVNENLVEFKLRTDNQAIDINVLEVIDKIKSICLN
ncbi:MAG: proline--tRNA ligase [Bacilli bacterium]|nr:proline--tRNA ligase [Bacilli bacterium]